MQAAEKILHVIYCLLTVLDIFYCHWTKSHTFTLIYSRENPILFRSNVVKSFDVKTFHFNPNFQYFIFETKQGHTNWWRCYNKYAYNENTNTITYVLSKSNIYTGFKI